MALSLFGYVLIAAMMCAPIAAIWALIASRMRSHFQILDIGTLLLPPLAFIIASSLRPELQVGWAMLFWPVIIGVATMYALPLKAIALSLNISSPKRLSTNLFFVCLVVAVLLAFMVSPWYD